MKLIDAMNDKSLKCFSIMLRMNSQEYMMLIADAYSENGAIDGQRKPLTSRTGKRIREAMKSDIKKGTVLPPLVIGCVISNEKFLEFEATYDVDGINDALITEIIAQNSLSIIDGVQRTTALKEILDDAGEDTNDLRVELWITNSCNSLIYRMLVLNTGQISWNLKKQLEVVFNHVKEQIEQTIPITIYVSNDNQRSTGPGTYQVSHLVELYIAFTTRSEDFDLNEKVAEKFATLDVTDLTSKFDHLDLFIKILGELVNIDKTFTDEKIGKRLFGDHYARLGFVIACAREIFGRTGVTKGVPEVIASYDNINLNINEYVKKISKMSNEELKEFTDVETLLEIIAGKRKGELIDFYTRAFLVLVEEQFEIESMEVCWRI